MRPWTHTDTHTHMHTHTHTYTYTYTRTHTTACEELCALSGALVALTDSQPTKTFVLERSVGKSDPISALSTVLTVLLSPDRLLSALMSPG